MVLIGLVEVVENTAYIFIALSQTILLNIFFLRIFSLDYRYYVTLSVYHCFSLRNISVMLNLIAYNGEHSYFRILCL